jgi:phosphate transport system permease protein
MSSSTSTALPRALAGGAKLRSRARQKAFEGIILGLLVLSASFSIVVTFTIIVVLFGEAMQFFRMPDVTLSEFLFTTQWNPLLGETKHFGVWPLVCGTVLVTTVAMLVAVPLGLITAVYLSEYAPRKVRSFIKPTLEILAGVPTVVYGFFALTVITPALKWFDDGFNIYNVFSAGIAVGILCLPTISSLAEDALQAVPRGLREGAFGLGGTKFDTTVKVVLPAALSGIVSAILLASARAIGETMIVALAAGSRAQITLDVRQPVQTITAFMVQMAHGDVSNFSVEYYSMYAVAAVLFLMTFTLTIVGQIIRQRFREVYQ